MKLRTNIISFWTDEKTANSIERMVQVLNYHQVKLNGNDIVTDSSLVRHVFEHKDLLGDFFNILKLKDKNGDDIKKEKIEEIIKEILK